MKKITQEIIQKDLILILTADREEKDVSPDLSLFSTTLNFTPLEIADLFIKISAKYNISPSDIVSYLTKIDSKYTLIDITKA